jgi:hypothetical protein
MKDMENLENDSINDEFAGGFIFKDKQDDINNYKKKKRKKKRQKSK